MILNIVNLKAKGCDYYEPSKFLSLSQQYLQSTSNIAPTAAAPVKRPNTTKNVAPKYPQRIGQVKVGSPNSSQAPGVNSDTKLVEMINTAIVDRSPSVRWEDVGKNPCIFAFFSFLCVIKCLILSMKMQLDLKRRSKL